MTSEERFAKAKLDNIGSRIADFLKEEGVYFTHAIEDTPRGKTMKLFLAVKIGQTEYFRGIPLKTLVL